MINKDSEYISLKEAAQLSGYSADYIGQLIRNGKIHGKQVFLNVAWMTTKDAIDEYLQKDKKKDEKPKSVWQKAHDVFVRVETLQKLYVGVVYFFLGVLCMFVIFLAYVLAVSIDHKIESEHLEKIQYAQE